MAEARGPTEDKQRLAAELRALRVAARLSTYQLARALGWSQAKVSKMERGQSPAAADDVAAWAVAVGAGQPRQAELVTLAAAVANEMRQWREVHGGGLAARQHEVAAIHASMTGLREFAPYAVPGLLQTEAYAAGVLELADVAHRGAVAGAVTARLARQAILLDPSRSFRFVLTEEALSIRFGPDEAMHGQRAKILAAAQLPNVWLGVLPRNRAAVTLESSGFVLYDLPDGPLLLIELLSRELQVRAEWDVRIYRDAFARLEAATVTGEAAAALIRGLLPAARHATSGAGPGPCRRR